jgi:S1-C subfamily serine protease
MPVLDEVQAAIQKVRTAVEPSVVGVSNHHAWGSGIVFAPGKVLTNAHNLRGRGITITFSDGRTAEATASGVDVDGDVAVLEVDTGNAPALEWGAAGGAEIGSPVFAVSNPGGRGLRVTVGYVSGTERSFRGPRGRRIAGTIEHTAPLLPGSSGGPTVDGNGTLVGINTNRLGEGFYLAIPADDALRERAEKLARGEAPKRARLGVAIAPAHVARGLRRAVGLPEVDGVLVRGVEEDSPAARADLKEGDLITRAAGRSVTEPDELHDALQQATGSIELTIVRGTEEKTVSVALD